MCNAFIGPDRVRVLDGLQCDGCFPVGLLLHFLEYGREREFALTLREAFQADIDVAANQVPRGQFGPRCLVERRCAVQAIQQVVVQDFL